MLHGGGNGLETAAVGITCEGSKRPDLQQSTVECLFSPSLPAIFLSSISLFINIWGITLEPDLFLFDLNRFNTIN